MCSVSKRKISATGTALLNVPVTNLSMTIMPIQNGEEPLDGYTKYVSG